MPTEILFDLALSESCQEFLSFSIWHCDINPIRSFEEWIDSYKFQWAFFVEIPLFRIGLDYNFLYVFKRSLMKLFKKMISYILNIVQSRLIQDSTSNESENRMFTINSDWGLVLNQIYFQPICVKWGLKSFPDWFGNTFWNGSEFVRIEFQSENFVRDIFSLLSKSESVKFSQIESVICFFTDSPVKKYILLLNQLIITEWISKKCFHCLIS